MCYSLFPPSAQPLTLSWGEPLYAVDKVAIPPPWVTGIRLVLRFRRGPSTPFCPSMVSVRPSVFLTQPPHPTPCGCVGPQYPTQWSTPSGYGRPIPPPVVHSAAPHLIRRRREAPGPRLQTHVEVIAVQEVLPLHPPACSFRRPGRWALPLHAVAPNPPPACLYADHPSSPVCVWI